MSKNRAQAALQGGSAAALPPSGPQAADHTDSPGLALRLSVWVAVLAVALLFVMVVMAALPAIKLPGPGGPLDRVWQPAQDVYKRQG